MSANPLDNFQKRHDFLVAIDSDGCAFDTMEVKHKECFIPNTIRYFGLQPISRYGREAAEFVNLYSKWRGINRFPALTMTLDLLRERPEVTRRGVRIDQLQSVEDWMKRETKLGMPALKAEVERTGDPDLKRTYEWSKAVNEAVDEIVFGVPPFPFVRESLEKLVGVADVIVCSATPGKALQKEWEEHKIAGYTRAICGQEVGSKKEILGARHQGGLLAAKCGDDRRRTGRSWRPPAASSALYYPVNPGNEDASWERFYQHACERFLNGNYVGPYEADLVAEFDTYLPETPPWKKS